jgi:8-oxo-dGTP diphosphatase
MERNNMPMVGLGVIIINEKGQILIGKRKGTHAPYYSIPGGKLETGETFEMGAIREVKEETGLEIRDPKVIAVTNNLETYHEEGIHFISITLLVTDYSGQVKVMEPVKCEEWLWADPENLPSPHFEASSMAITCYLEKRFY